MIGVVGMPWPEGLQYIAVVLAAMICIFNEKANWRPSSFTFKYAGQNLNPVLFFALRHVA